MLPICGPCSKRAILCPECQKLYDDGAIGVLDIEVSRIVAEIVEDDVDIMHAVATRDRVIIVAAEEHIGAIIGESGSSIREISARLGKKAKVIGAGDFEKLARALIAPVRVKSINTVRLPGGGKSLRVRVNRSDISDLRMDPCDLDKVISSVTEIPVQLIFD